MFQTTNKISIIIVSDIVILITIIITYIMFTPKLGCLLTQSWPKNLPIPTISQPSQPSQASQASQASKAQCRDDNHGIEPVPGRVRSTEVASGTHGSDAQEEFHREEAAFGQKGCWGYTWEKHRSVDIE